MPELMSLCPCPQEQSYRASVPQNFPLNSWERQPAVDRSLFEPAEHRPARRETDSEWSRRLSEPEFQIGQLGSQVAMTQRREAMLKCLEGLASAHVAGLPMVKNPAHQPERQLALAFGCHEPSCRLSQGRPGAQLPPRATAGRQPPPRFAPGASAGLASAAERLSSKGYRSDQIAFVGAQFCQAIRGSFP